MSAWLVKLAFVIVCAGLALVLADLLWALTAGGRPGMSDTLIGYRIWRF